MKPVACEAAQQDVDTAVGYRRCRVIGAKCSVAAVSGKRPGMDVACAVKNCFFARRKLAPDYL